MTQQLVLSQWSAISAFGFGQDAFTNGLRSGDVRLSSVDHPTRSGPDLKACLVPDFNVRKAFEGKGTRALDRATGLAMAAVGQILEQMNDSIGAEQELALVLGTTAGSVQSAMDFVKDSFVKPRPFQVDPARFPNAVMNRAAGQCAIWHNLRGPNATVAGGRAASLLALKYGARLHRRERAETVLCGAVEEYSSQRARLDWMIHPERSESQFLGEGCALFALERAGTAKAHKREPLAELVSVTLGVWSAVDPIVTVLSSQLQRALTEIGGRTQSVRAVVIGGGAAPNSLVSAESDAVHSVLNGVPQVTIEDLLGDTGAAAAGFQLAAAMTIPGDQDQPYVFVTSVDHDGVVGCVVIKHL